jgi:tetratricopeptide (TPR) repeat protein
MLTAVPARDWEAEIAAATDPATRWQILFDAGRWHEDGEDLDRAQAYYQRALDVAGDFAPDDLRAVDSRMALARSSEDGARATALYEAAMAGLGSAQGKDRLRIADVLEALHSLKADAPPEARIARLQHALAIRESLPDGDGAKTRATRRELARLLDASGDLQGAEALLQRNLEPAEGAAASGARSHPPRLDLAWFLMAHGRAGEAEALLQPVAGGEAAAQAEDRLRVAMAWAQMEQGKLDEAAAAFQDLLERDSRDSPAPRGVARIELLFDLALVAQRRGDGMAQGAWLAEARETLKTLPESVAASLRGQRYADLTAAAPDWEALRWQRYGQVAAAL